VLLHQNPSSSVEYESFAAEMARDRRVIAFDTPGFGMSDRPAERPGLEGYAAAFAEGIDALDLAARGKVDVFGFHTGTYLAVELALLRPDRVGRLILSGIPFRPPDQRAERLAAALAPFTFNDDGTQVFDHLRKMWAFTVQERDQATPLDRAVQLFLERIRPMPFQSWPYVGVWSYEAEARLPQVAAPVLILQPHEPLLEHSRAAAGLFRSVTWVEFPELNRDVFEAGASRFAEAIRAWKG
jgi:pimeloyl-ACP methyl ester carboxylesterase